MPTCLERCIMNMRFMNPFKPSHNTQPRPRFLEILASDNGRRSDGTVEPETGSTNRDLLERRGNRPVVPHALAQTVLSRALVVRSPRRTLRSGGRAWSTCVAGLLPSGLDTWAQPLTLGPFPRAALVSIDSHARQLPVPRKAARILPLGPSVRQQRTWLLRESLERRQVPDGILGAP